jgi:hypothetical protein
MGMKYYMSFWLLHNGIFTHSDAEFNDKQLPKCTYFDRLRVSSQRAHKLSKLQVMTLMPHTFFEVCCGEGECSIFHVGGAYSAHAALYVFDNCFYNKCKGSALAVKKPWGTAMDHSGLATALFLSL